MGGFKEKMPVTYWSMLISTLAIAGVPLFSGFLSKDAILAGTLGFVQQHPEHFLLAVFGFGAAAITAFYMFRLIFMTFHGKPSMKDIFKDIHESPKEMTGPIVVLGTLSFFIFYTLPYFNPISDHGWFKDLVVPQTSAVLGSMTANEIAEHAHHAHYLAMGLSIAVATIGILLAVLMYYKNIVSPKKLSGKFGFLYDWSLNKFYFDENYNRFLYQPLLKLSDTISWLDWEFYDKYFINGIGRATNLLSKLSGKFDYDGIDQGLVDGLGRITDAGGKNLRKIQTGRLQNYLLYVVAGILVIIIIQAF
jgi:NADH-quinone oxidoreductase subunit L